MDTIRSDPKKLLDKDVKFFGDPEEEVQRLERGTDKPVYLKDYHRMALMGELPDDEAEENGEKPFAIQQEEDRKKLIAEINADADGDEDDFLTVRKEQRTVEPVDLPNPDENEKGFLEAFINNKAWLPKNVDKETGQEIAPTYGEIVEDDEEFDDIADTFETAYNFRYEDPNANEIVGYARNQSTLRRSEENSRKRARDKKKEAKRAEEEKRKAEIAKLKKHKVQQVMSKLEKLKEAIGDNDVAEALKDVDLDGEFDDTEWDRKMLEVFNDEFYAKADDSKKPEFSDIEVDGLEDEEDEDDGDDDDEDKALEQEDSSKKSKAKAKKEEKLKQKKEREELRSKAEEFVEENLDLALEDADIKLPKATFKYREVEPESFGLTARDILLASDKDLNEFAGLKAYATWREPSKKEKDKKKFAKKRRLREWRKAVFNSEEAPDDAAFQKLLESGAQEEERRAKKQKKNKKKN